MGESLDAGRPFSSITSATSHACGGSSSEDAGS
jgi:hypothetical protein